MCTSEPGHWPEGARRTGRDVEITARDGTTIPLHVCHPEGEGPWPTVLIVHDYFDPEHFYHELACRYAGAGYLGVVPSLFHRHPKLAEQTHAAAGERILAVTDQEVLDDVDAVIEHLEQNHLASGLAVSGFCWGGRMAYVVAARHPEVRLLLPFYGHFAAWSGPDGPKPYSPLEEAGKISARVLGFYGGADPSIPVEGVREMERKLREHGLQADLKVVEGAPHSFFRMKEHAAESEAAWAEVLAALGETLAPA
ncbi:MAG TPA: dienelactone hydrolase family protein [Candidatus Dormibacteraeota bacterium]|jgi:carboxymethylenebutenolidase|nr:dienelactone hydrolase family protein [Candidatus Dormibacteraeota bacterium]